VRDAGGTGGHADQEFRGRGGGRGLRCHGSELGPPGGRHLFPGFGEGVFDHDAGLADGIGDGHGHHGLAAEALHVHVDVRRDDHDVGAGHVLG
jgi:hypothetical protein